MSGLFLIVAMSYLLGSIPFGYLLVQSIHGEDVRQSGSGNIGATNVSRRSPALGILTLLLDALKGAAAVGAAMWLSRPLHLGPLLALSLSVAALFAVMGHVFPVWLKFRGGKGVATALGSFIVIAPWAVLMAAAIFILAVLLFRFVSLGSMLAVAFFPFLAFEMHAYGNSSSALALVTATCLLIIARHHENIRRLIGGNENRIGEGRA